VIRRLPLLTALLLLAQANTHTIRVAMNGDVGQSVKVHHDAVVKQTITVHNAEGKALGTAPREDDNVEEWTGTTVRRAAGSATYRRTWTKAEKVANGTKRFSPLQGLNVTFTVRGDHVGMMASNGMPLVEEMRQNIEELERNRLHAEANNFCVPVTPLAVGSTWTIGAEEARDCFSELAVLTGPVAASGTVTSIDGNYATIDFRFAMKLSALGSIELVSPAPLDGTMRLRASLTDPLDWTSTKTFHIVGTMRPPGETQSATTDLHGTVTFRTSRG